MKILHIQAGDLSSGAARGTLWLHQALRRCGVDSRLLLQKEQDAANGIYSMDQSLLQRGKHRLRERCERSLIERYKDRKKQLFSTGLFGRDITKLKMYGEADIVHMHWINLNMIDIRVFTKIKKPVVWTFRDMWPFTGGCHYSDECTRFENGCGYCIHLHSSSGHDLSRRVFREKKNAYTNNIHPIAISHWLREAALHSQLFRDFDIRVIHNGVDTEIFKPVDKGEAKKILGLTDRETVLIAAQSHNDSYKGFDKFLDAVEHVKSGCYYLVLGNVDEQILKERGIDYRLFGFLRDDLSLRLLYSAADVFVAPSTQEAFGKTIIEAMACGTPVVCFDATGPKDIVDHQLNGYRAKPFDSVDLAAGIDWLLSDDIRRRNLGENARNRVVSNFDIMETAKQYMAFYKERLKK